MRQILCVIDFSESSGKVLDVAARIASACKAHLIILFPYRLIDHSFQGKLTSLRSQLETEAKDKFNTLKKNLPVMESVSCEFQPEIGFIADRIKAHVSKDPIDMIIVGQEQTAATKSDLTGYNIQNLIATSNLPFVIVPANVNQEAGVH